MIFPTYFCKISWVFFNGKVLGGTFPTPKIRQITKDIILTEVLKSETLHVFSLIRVIKIAMIRFIGITKTFSFTIK